MTRVQKVISKLVDFIHAEKDKNTPNLELTLEEVKILYNLTC